MTRIRLILDDSEQQNLRKCWFTVDHLQTPTIESLIHALKSRFSLCTSSKIDFFLDDFEIPVFENSNVLRDNDLVRVKVTSDQDANDYRSSKILRDSYAQHGPNENDFVSSSTERMKKKHSSTVGEYESSSSKTSDEKERKKRKKQKSNKSKDRESGDLKDQRETTPVAVSQKKKKLLKVPEATAQGQEPSSSHPEKKRKSPAKKSAREEMDSSSSDDEPETVITKKKVPSVAEEEADRKLQEFIDNLPEVKRQRRGGRTRKRKPRKGKNAAQENVQLNSVDASFQETGIGNNQVTFEGDMYPQTATTSTAVPDETGEDFLIHDKNSWQPKNRQGRENNKKQKKKGRRNGVVNAPQLSELVVEPEPEFPRTDYSVYPLLRAPMSVGDRIAFKVIEMSANYEPVLSDFKVADIVSTEGDHAELKMIEDGGPVQRSGKFELGRTYQDDQEQQPESSTTWYEINSLVDVRKVEIIQEVAPVESPPDEPPIQIIEPIPEITEQNIPLHTDVLLETQNIDGSQEIYEEIQIELVNGYDQNSQYQLVDGAEP